jgi:spore coat protein A, manganese oxidase
VYRFRVLNGSNARFYNLRLRSQNTPSPQLYQIGTDGGLLNAPVEIGAQQGLLLGPGERADVLVDFARCKAGGKVLVTNDAAAPFPSGPHGRHPGGDALTELLQFTVGSSAGFQGPIPSALRGAGSPAGPNSIPTLPPPVRVRNLALVEILDPATGTPIQALLNNLPWHTTQIETPKVNTVEQWNIINTTGDAHPIHLHLVQFQILNRQKFNVNAYLAALNATLPAPGLPHPNAMERGPWTAQGGAPSADRYVTGPAAAPDPGERGWKDTVRAMPGEVARLLIPFGAGAAPNLAIGQSFTGDYVWHCHILEHEDNEMMLPYRVTA